MQQKLRMMQKLARTIPESSMLLYKYWSNSITLFEIFKKSSCLKSNLTRSTTARMACNMDRRASIPRAAMVFSIPAESRPIKVSLEKLLGLLGIVGSLPMLVNPDGVIKPPPGPWCWWWSGVIMLLELTILSGDWGGTGDLRRGWSLNDIAEELIGCKPDAKVIII